MKSVITTFKKGSSCLPLLAVAFSGCATVDSGQVIKTGDTVGVHFTCRLPNSAIAISSEKDVNTDTTQPKAPFFLPRVGDETLEVVAGIGEAGPANMVEGFEKDVLHGIAVAMPGLRPGEKRTLELLSSDATYGGLKMARVRQMGKERLVTVDEFKEHTKKEPEVGQAVQFGEGLPSVVREVRDGKVSITFSAPDGTIVPTPIGPGKVRDAGKAYDIVVDAKEGDLMRVGPLVGRIASVDDHNIDLDFSKTFGGENLRCDVKVESIKASDASTPDGSAVRGGATAAQPQQAEATDPDSKKGAAILGKAVADAVKGGGTSVSLDMDAVMNGAAKGDLVTVRFAVKDAGGAPLSLPEGMANQDLPQEIIAGRDEIFPGLGDAVIGMAPGVKKQITLPPEKAFGKRDESKQATYLLKNTYPATMTIPADEYVKSYGGFPTLGKEVPLAPYFTTKVASIGEKEVTLAITAQDGARFSRPFGTIVTSVGRDSITVQLDPKLGAPFNSDNRQGLITSSNGETFTVDFNHPLAGKTIRLDLEVVDVSKVADLKTKTIDWIEDYEKGLAAAKREGKPVVLVLYADWCGFCKRLFAETMPDPRIEQVSDKFVWVRVNSDKAQQYKKQFGQDGFPLIVLLKSDGTVARKIDGYREAGALKAELDGTL